MPYQKGSGSGSGITQLSGDVTAGPGSGIQAATLVATTAVKAIIAAYSAVTSVFGRTGAVAAQKGDYTTIMVPPVVGTVTQSATPSINSNNYSQVEITGVAQAITSLTDTGTPVDGQALTTVFASNGTQQSFTPGSGFVTGGAGASLPSSIPATGYLFINWIYSSALAAWVYQSSNTASGGASLSTIYTGTLGSQVTLPNTTTTILTTTSLPVGTYDVFFSAYVTGITAGSQSVDVKVVAGTATATITGQAVASAYYGTQISFRCQVVITVAGTLVFQGVPTGGYGYINAVSQAGGQAGVTGYFIRQ